MAVGLANMTGHTISSGQPIPSAGSDVLTAPIATDDIAAFHANHPVERSTANLRWRTAVVIEIVAILVIWEIAVGRLGLISQAFLPAPSSIVISLIELPSTPGFMGHLVFSVTNMIIGVTLASVVGITVGLIVGWWRVAEIFVAPILWTIYSIPKVALVPLIILGLGLGSPSKIMVVFLLGVFPVTLNTMEGVRTVDPSFIKAARVFGLKDRTILRKVVLPAAFPFVLVGVKRAIALGFIGEMLGEFLGGAYGIGVLLERATFDFRMDDALAIVLIMVVTANLGLFILDRIRRRVAPWHVESNSLRR